MTKKITSEEKSLLDSVDMGEWKSIKDNELSKYKQSAHKTLQREHTVSVSVPEDDFMLLRRRSLDCGISPEMLVRSLIHKYATGKVKLTV